MTEKVILVSQLSTIQSKTVAPIKVSWKKFTDGIILLGHDLQERKNFRVSFISFTGFKGGRKKKHISHIGGLILDFDGDLTLLEIEKLLTGLNYLMYSTHSHMQDGNTVKVRVLLPFKNRCSAEAWYDRVETAKQYFAGCDPSSLYPTQFQALPNCPKSRLDHAFIKHSEGRFFDWCELEPIRSKKPRRPSKVERTNHARDSDSSARLSADVIIYHKHGQIAAGAIDSHIQEVYCPNHSDNFPSEFANVNSNGDPYIHCKTCGTLWIGSNEETLTLEASPKPVKPARSDIREKLKAAVDSNIGTSLIYAPEGSGKSYCAVLLSQNGRKVIFACHSYIQAKEKYSSLTEGGLRVKLLESRAYRIEKLYGVKPVRGNSRHPWDVGEINDKATLIEINRNHPEGNIEQIDSSCDADPIPEFDWRDCDVYLTTHAYLAHIGRINMNRIESGFRPLIDDSVSIIYDDPVIHDVLSFAPYSDSYDNKTIDSQPIEEFITIRDNRRYVVKPDRYKLGYGLTRNPLFVTTTELLVKLLFEHQHPDTSIVDDLMPTDGKLLGGDVHLISTKMVRSKFDGILPPIMERIKRLGFQFEYIANGQGCKINLSNNKGVNNLADVNTVVELSIPPVQESLLLYEQFNDELSQREISAALMLDKLNQAIGRNSGFRSMGKSCVVLVDPNYAKAMLSLSRYTFSSVKQPDRDQPTLYPRRHSTFPDLVSAVCWFLNRYRVYLSDGRKFYHDCVKAVKAAPDKSQKQRIQRINIAIQSVIAKHPGDKLKLSATQTRLHKEFNHLL